MRTNRDPEPKPEYFVKFRLDSKGIPKAVIWDHEDRDVCIVQKTFDDTEEEFEARAKDIAQRLEDTDERLK